MTCLTPTRLAFCLSLATFAATGGPTIAQSAPSIAQCDAVMMVGTQHFSPAMVAGCTAYFQALADGAAARGTFATPVPRPHNGPAVRANLSTSDNGG